MLTSPARSLIYVLPALLFLAGLAQAGNLTIAAGANTPPAQTQLNNATFSVFQLKLTADAASGNVTVTAITFDGQPGATDMNESTTVASARLYRDLDGDGLRQASEPLLDSETVFTNNGDVAFTGFSVLILDGQNTHVIMEVTLNGTAPRDQQFLYDVTQADITVDGGSTVNAATITGSQMTIKDPFNNSGDNATVHVYAGTANPPNSTELVNASNVPCLQIKVWTSTVQNVQIEEMEFDAGAATSPAAAFGPGVNPNRVLVKVYQDKNGDGFVDGGDKLLTTSLHEGNDPVKIKNIAHVLSAGSIQYFLVVLDFAAANAVNEANGDVYEVNLPDANMGNWKLNGQILDPTSGDFQRYKDALTGSAPSTVDGGHITLGAAPAKVLTVTVGEYNPAGTQVFNNKTNLAVFQVNLRANSAGTITVNTVIFTGVQVNTADVDELVDITAGSVKLYDDVNRNGVFDSGIDSLFGAGQSYSADDGVAKFEGMGMAITAGSNKSLLLVYDLAGSATNGEQFRVKINATGDVKSDAGSTVFPSAVQSEIFTITSTATLTIAAGPNNPPDRVAGPGSAQVSTIQLAFTAEGAAVDLATVTLNIQGTAHDVNEVKSNSIFLILDSNGDGVANASERTVSDGNYNWSADNGNVAITFKTDVQGNADRKINNGQTRYYLLIFDFSTTDVPEQGDNFRVSFNADTNVTTSAGTETRQGAPFQGGLITVANIGTLSIALGTAVNENIAANQQDVAMIQVKLTTGSYEDVYVSEIEFLASGTGDDRSAEDGGDLANRNTETPILLYRDTNCNGVLDVGEPSLVNTAVNAKMNDDTFRWEIGGSGDGKADWGGVTVAKSTTQCWLVVYDYRNPGTASNSETFVASLSDLSKITAKGTVTTNTIYAGGNTGSGGTKTVGSTVGSLTVTAGGANPAPQTVGPGATGVVAMQVRLAANVTDITINTVQFAATGGGTAPGNPNTHISKVEVYFDADADGVLDVGETRIATTPTVYTAGALKFQGLGRVIAAGTSEHWIVIWDFVGGEANGNTYQSSLSITTATIKALDTQPAAVTAAVDSTTITGGQVDISNIGILTVTDGNSDAPDHNEGQGATNVVMWQFKLAANSSENIRVDSIRFTAQGEIPDGNDLTEVVAGSLELHLDVNNDGLLDGGDTLLGVAGSWSANNGTFLVTGIATQINASTNKQFLVVHDFTAGVTLLDRFRVGINTNADVGAGGLTGAPHAATVTGAFITGSLITIANTGSLSINVTAANPGAQTKANNDTNVKALAISLTASSAENINITQIIFNASGTGDDRNAGSGGDLANLGVKLYRDGTTGADGDGDFQVADAQIVTGNFDANNGKVTFSGLGEVINSATTEIWFLVFDFGGTASNGETFQATLNADSAGNDTVTATGATSGSNIIPSGPSPWTGGLITIGNSLTIALGASNPAGASVGNNATFAVLQFRLTAGNGGAITVTTIKLQASGTANDLDAIEGAGADPDGVILVLDVDGSGTISAGDTNLAGGTSPGTQTNYSANDGVAAFEGLALVIGSGATSNILVVYNLRGAATPASNGQTFQASVLTNASVVSSTAGVVIAGAPVNSNTFTVSGTTYVALAELRAEGWVGQARVFWTTTLEIDNLGFYVYRSDDPGSGYRRIAPQLILGLGTFFSGGQYVFQDKTVEAGRTYFYILEDVELNGRATLHGPVQAFIGSTAAPPILLDSYTNHGETAAAQPAPGETEPLAGDAAPLPVPTGPGDAVANPPYQAPAVPEDAIRQRENAGQQAALLRVDQDGMQRLTGQQLADAGAGFLLGARTRELALYRRGIEQALFIEDGGDGRFDTADAVVFHGQYVRTERWRGEFYWLTRDARQGLRMEAVAAAPAGEAFSPPSVQTIKQEVDALYTPSLPDSQGTDNWLWKLVTANGAAAGVDLPAIDLPHPAAQGRALLRVLLRGRTRVAGVAPDHHARLAINGQVVSDFPFDGDGLVQRDIVFDQALLRAGSNVLRLELPGDLGLGVEQVYLDRYELHYFAEPTAAADRHRAQGGPGARYEVAGFTANDIRAYQVSDPARPRRLTGIEVAGAGPYTAALKLPAGDHRLATVAAHHVPAVARINIPSALHADTQGAQWLSIAHRGLLGQAGRLAAQRAAQGYRVKVVDVEDVFDEFSYGQSEPSALRAFLAHALANWPAPRLLHVCLLGDGNADPNNNWHALYPGQVPFQEDLIPSRQIQTDMGEAPSDNWIADCLNDDGLPDVYLGRLPAKDVAEAAAMVDKILAHESRGALQDWERQSTLVADNPASAQEQVFEDSCDLIAALLPSGQGAERLFLADIGGAAARTGLLSALNAGRGFVHYAGHGADRFWAQEQILKNTDIAGLTAHGRLPIVTVMNCRSGLFANAWYESVGEALLKRAARGAVACWAPTGLTQPAAQGVLAEAFYRAAFAARCASLGEAVYAAQLAGRNLPGGREAIHSWVLLGDPALRLRR